MASTDQTGGRWRPPGFGEVRPLVAFLVLFSGIVLLSSVLWDTFFEVDASLESAKPGVYLVWSAVSSAVQFVLALLILKYEGIDLRDIGLSRTLIVPALIAGGTVIIAINGAVAALGASAGDSLAVGFFPLYQPLVPSFSAGLLAASGVHAYLFVGPAEELAFRGYLQNKIVSLFGKPTRGTRAGAVVLAAFSFGLIHIPIAFIGSDLSVSGVVGTVLLTGITGIVFGVIYELTRNLYLVMILHGFGDWWPIFVDAGSVGWPNWGVIVLVYTLLVVAYRRWGSGVTERASTLHRRVYR